MSTEALLATLQNADSFFPGGSIAFSWGLETLIADRQVCLPEALGEFLAAQLDQRWAVCDRAMLVAAFRTAGDLAQLCAIDRELETLMLAEELRDGSKRAGASLLAVHERIGTGGAARYREAVRGGAALGHLPVVQAVVWQGAGLDETAAQAASAHTFCVGLLGAALRLGCIGHLQCQETLRGMRNAIARVIDSPPPDLSEIYTCTPAIEIASMRHELQVSRLFAN